MSNGRFICSMQMPITLDMIDGYAGTKPIVNIGMGGGKIREYVISKLPSLKNQDFNICF
jgi:hypothetical protein